MLQVEDAELVGAKYLTISTALDCFTRSAVNVRTISNGFLLDSLVTTLVSLEEVCLPSFEVLNFSSLWQSVGRERLLRAASTSCLYLSQLAFFRFTYVRRRPGLEGVFICNLMRIGRWSELSVDSICQEHEVMRDAGANETSGELGSAFGGTLVGLSQLRIP